MSEKVRASQPPKETIAPRHESLLKEFDHGTGPAPLGYGEARLWLVARDSHSVFAYWELKPEEHPEAMAPDGESHFILRILREEGTVETTSEIRPDAGDWTVAVPQADTYYIGELGFYTRQGVWCFLARSSPTRTPPHPGCLPGATTPQGELFRAGESAPIPWSEDQEARLSELLAEETRKASQRRAPKRPRTGKPPRRDPE